MTAYRAAPIEVTCDPANERQMFWALALVLRVRHAGPFSEGVELSEPVYRLALGESPYDD